MRFVCKASCEILIQEQNDGLCRSSRNVIGMHGWLRVAELTSSLPRALTTGFNANLARLGLRLNGPYTIGVLRRHACRNRRILTVSFAKFLFDIQQAPGSFKGCSGVSI